MESRQKLLPRYQLHLHRHVRIWLSMDEDIFLNPENRLRLIRMRVDNPTDTITFIYAKQLLSKYAQEKLHAFCKAHNIEPLDIEDLKPNLANDREKELMGYAEEEMRRAKNNTAGNLGAASDILRCLSPVCYKGIYSDFDTKIKTADLPESIIVHAPVIATLGSIIHDIPMANMEYEYLSFNNDILAFPEVDLESCADELEIFSRELQEEKIKAIHEWMISCYQNPGLALMNFIKKRRDSLGLIFDDLTELEAFDVDLAVLLQIVEKKFGTTIFEIRQNIDLKHSSIERFVSAELENFVGNEIGEELAQRQFKCTLSEVLKNEKCHATLKKFLVKIMKEIVMLSMPNLMLSVDKDETVIKNRMQAFKLNAYKTTVTYITGPFALASLFDKLAFTTEEKEVFNPYCWEHYGLFFHFDSPLKIKLGTLFTEYQQMALTGKPGQYCDLSWTKEGLITVKEHERKMHSSAKCIQMWSKKYLRQASEYKLTSARLKN